MQLPPKSTQRLSTEQLYAIADYTGMPRPFNASRLNRVKKAWQMYSTGLYRIRTSAGVFSFEVYRADRATKPYIVTHDSCTCMDWIMRGRDLDNDEVCGPCKHMIYLRLYAPDLPVTQPEPTSDVPKGHQRAIRRGW